MSTPNTLKEVKEKTAVRADEWCSDFLSQSDVFKELVIPHSDGTSVYCKCCDSTLKMNRPFGLSNWLSHVDVDTHIRKREAYENTQ